MWLVVRHLCIMYSHSLGKLSLAGWLPNIIVLLFYQLILQFMITSSLIWKPEDHPWTIFKDSSHLLLDKACLGRAVHEMTFKDAFRSKVWLAWVVTLILNWLSQAAKQRFAEKAALQGEIATLRDVVSKSGETLPSVNADASNADLAREAERLKLKIGTALHDSL